MSLYIWLFNIIKKCHFLRQKKKLSTQRYNNILNLAIQKGEEIMSDNNSPLEYINS